MENRGEAQKIQLNKNSSTTIYKNDMEKEIVIKDGFKLMNDNQIYSQFLLNTSSENIENWANISNEVFERFISNYKTRTEAINKIVELIIENKLNGVNIDFKDIKDYDSFKRFVIELTPRLREMGVATSLKLNNKTEKDDFKNIVDYIIE